MVALWRKVGWCVGFEAPTGSHRLLTLDLSEIGGFFGTPAFKIWQTEKTVVVTCMVGNLYQTWEKPPELSRLPNVTEAGRFGCDAMEIASTLR